MVKLAIVKELGGPFAYYIGLAQKLSFWTTHPPYVTLYHFSNLPPMLYNKLKRHPVKMAEPEIDVRNCHNHSRGSGKVQLNAAGQQHKLCGCGISFLYI